MQARLGPALRRTAAARKAESAALARRLRQGVARQVDRKRERVAQLAQTLDALSPLAALSRGFAVPLDHAGRILRDVAAFVPGERVHLRVSDGTVDCRTERAVGGDE